MATTKKKTETEDCPTCHGEGTVQGRYTDPPRPCPDCKGKGVIPKSGATSE